MFSLEEPAIAGPLVQGKRRFAIFCLCRSFETTTQELIETPTVLLILHAALGAHPDRG